MKKILMLFMICCYIFTFCQIKVTAAPKELILSENIIKIDSLSADQIYKNSLSWVNHTFKNPEIVLKSTVPNELLRISAIWQIPSKGVFGKTTLQMSYTMQIDIKDGKVRISVYDLKGLNKFMYSSCFKSSGEKRSSSEVQNYFIDIENYSSEFIANYLEFAKGKKEDW